MQKYEPLSKEDKWKAVINCDKSYDGVFYYGVKTTGIFCRPSCKAKAPLKDNTLFFDNIEDAIMDGFRPCKLCRPDIKTDNYEPNKDLVEEIKKRLSESYNVQFDLKAVAKEFCISASHLTRLFKEYAGITPSEFFIYTRIERATELLVKTDEKVLEIAFDSGFKSLSSFYKAFKESTGCTPNEYRKNNH